MRKTYLSFGGGVQTTALLILGYRGKVKFDEVIFADTGAERPDTYRYIDRYVRPLCSEMQIPFTVVTMDRKITDARSGEDMRVNSLRDYCRLTRRTPSTYNRWCTGYSKIAPIRSYIKEMQAKRVYSKPATSLIGISTDERHRAKGKDGRWKQPHYTEFMNDYPLLKLGISRRGCHDIIREFGWSEPSKSGCYFCPFQSGKEWQKLYIENEELFWDAVEIEEESTGFPKYHLYHRMPLRRLASGPGFGHGSLSIYDDYEGGACVEVEASCML